MIRRVHISEFAQKQLRKVPRYVAQNLQYWIDDVEDQGLAEVRKIPGYHDEPLKGFRKGQRSIRITRSYRAIYIILESQEIQFVSVEEVSKHDY